MKRMIRSSYDPTEADLYVIKIWYEVDPGHDVAAPEAAEEIIRVVAGSPDEALERAKMSWTGPIDRIEIVDINPEEEEEDLPFYACNDIRSATQKGAKQMKKMIKGTSGKSTSAEYIKVALFDYLCDNDYLKVDNEPAEEIAERIEDLKPIFDVDDVIARALEEGVTLVAALEMLEDEADEM